MKKNFVYLFLFIFQFSFLYSSGSHKLKEDTVTQAYNNCLKNYVHNGWVDYNGLQKEPTALDNYIKHIAHLKIDSIGKSEKMALLINAYNAFTLKLILNHYPLKSIKDIGSSKRWKAKIWTLGGTLVSLDYLENTLLRPMGDPRIHFAINCASISCPDLRNELFNANTLDEQLTDSSKIFLENIQKGSTIKMGSGWFSSGETLNISKIFSWFESDFNKYSGSVKNLYKNMLQSKLRNF